METLCDEQIMVFLGAMLRKGYRVDPYPVSPVWLALCKKAHDYALEQVEQMARDCQCKLAQQCALETNGTAKSFGDGAVKAMESFADTIQIERRRDDVEGS